MNEYRKPFLCKIGWHNYPRYVNAYSQAPAPVRCQRCGKPYGRR